MAVNRVVHKLSSRLRPLYHSVYPYAALNDLDKKLKPYLKDLDPIFLEVGANDGVRQSNTYYFQKRKGWNGILIEPVPRLANRCRTNRRHAHVVEAVLVSQDDSRTTIMIVDADLMSQIGEVPDHMTHMIMAEQVQGIKTDSVECRTMTMSQVIDESPFQRVSFISIDVEGYEIQVLKGLDFERHCPDYLLVETIQIKDVKNEIGRHMDLVAKLSHHDYLFRKQNL
jgi:FkbM family methyltransferase